MNRNDPKILTTLTFLLFLFAPQIQAEDQSDIPIQEQEELEVAPETTRVPTVPSSPETPSQAPASATAETAPPSKPAPEPIEPLPKDGLTSSEETPGSSEAPPSLSPLSASVTPQYCVNYAENLASLYDQKIQELQKNIEKARYRLKALVEYEASIQKEIDTLKTEIAKITDSTQTEKAKKKELAKPQKQLTRLNKQLADSQKNTQKACKEIADELAEIGAEQVKEIKDAFKEAQVKVQYNGQAAPSLFKTLGQKSEE